MENYDEVLIGYIMLNNALTNLDMYNDDSRIEAIINTIDKNVLQLQAILEKEYTDDLEEDIKIIEKEHHVSKKLSSILL